MVETQPLDHLQRSGLRKSPATSSEPQTVDYFCWTSVRPLTQLIRSILFQRHVDAEGRWRASPRHLLDCWARCYREEFFEKNPI